MIDFKQFVRPYTTQQIPQYFRYFASFCHFRDYSFFIYICVIMISYYSIIDID